VQLDYPRTRVCDVLDAPRSTIYAREGAARRAETGVVIAFPKRGPRTELPDDELLVLIRRVIQETPFSGEGHRKVTARITWWWARWLIETRCLPCRLGDQVGEVAKQLDTMPHDYCVVSNDHGIVLGACAGRTSRGRQKCELSASWSRVPPQ